MFLIRRVLCTPNLLWRLCRDVGVTGQRLTSFTLLQTTVLMRHWSSEKWTIWNWRYAGLFHWFANTRLGVQCLNDCSSWGIFLILRCWIRLLCHLMFGNSILISFVLVSGSNNRWLGSPPSTRGFQSWHAFWIVGTLWEISIPSQDDFQVETYVHWRRSLSLWDVSIVQCDQIVEWNHCT